MSTAGQPPDAWSRLASPRQRAACILAGAVLLAHALLLGSVSRAPGPGSRAQPPRTLQVRQIVLSAPPHAAPVIAVTMAEATLPAPAHRHAAAPRTAAIKASAAGGAIAAALAPPTTTAGAAVQAPVEHEAEPGGLTVPVYATRLPPPLALHFELRRGLVGGQATFDWRPQDDQYELTLRSQALGAQVIGWTSRGGFDSAGVAPMRYTESRRGREVRAANFQRDNGLITFSGPAVQYPLVPGAQDRLSWMVQLAAVLSANPALAVPEAQVLMWVVGTRGDAEVWTFTVQGRVALDLPIGRVDETVHLTREPRRPYDTQAQIWLDPARHYLPAKVSLLVRATGEGTVLELQQVLAR